MSGDLSHRTELVGRDRDAVVWRFMKAWESRDIQGVLNILNAREPMNRYLVGIEGGVSSKFFKHWMRKNTGVGKMLSDHMHAATRGRASGGWTHTNKYYASSPENRNAEIFADTISVAGESRFAYLLLRRFAPNILKEVKKLLPGMVNAAKSFKETMP